MIIIREGEKCNSAAQIRVHRVAIRISVLKKICAIAENPSCGDFPKMMFSVDRFEKHDTGHTDRHKKHRNGKKTLNVHSVFSGLLLLPRNSHSSA